MDGRKEFVIGFDVMSWHFSESVVIKQYDGHETMCYYQDDWVLEGRDGKLISVDFLANKLWLVFAEM